MKTTLCLISSFALMSACATTAPPPEEITPEVWAKAKAAMLVEDAAPAPDVRYVERVETLPLKGQIKRIAIPPDQPKYSPKEAIRAGVEGARIEPSVDGFINAVQVLPFTEGALYRLYCAPGQISDIALEPGEELISVSAGDTIRWVVGDTRSGAGPNARSHVLVKPHTAGLSTNLMIATDRRSYYLELESTDDAYMAALSWRYPASELEQIRADHAARLENTRRVASPAIDLKDVNFNYRISGDNTDWKPLRAFDDGRQVFIQMPGNIGATDMPPLFVLGDGGDAELVNYRIKGHYYIVDRLFDAAELRHGTKHQKKVRIRKLSAHRPFWEDMFGG